VVEDTPGGGATMIVRLRQAPPTTFHPEPGAAEATDGTSNTNGTAAAGGTPPSNPVLRGRGPE
jgi:hypothetical protein